MGIKMKKILFLLFVLPIIINPQTEPTKKIYIEKNKSGGFNLYNSDKEILWKSYKENTDSVTLDLLNDVYMDAKSGIDKPEVTLVNLNEKGFDWLTLIIAILGIGGTFSSGYFVNRWNSKSQLERYKNTVQIDNVKKWISDLQENIAKFIGLNYEFYFSSDVLESKNFLDVSRMETAKVLNEIELVTSKISFVLNINNVLENKLFLKISELKDLTANHYQKSLDQLTTGKYEEQNDKEDYSQLVGDIRGYMNRIIGEKQQFSQLL